jgi:hypothetical protein
MVTEQEHDMPGEPDDATEPELDGELVELYEVLEWARAVEEEADR